MPQSNSNRPSGAPGQVPLDGPYNHLELPRKKITDTKANIAKLKAIMADISRNSALGSHDAADAGYDAACRNEVMMLARECQALSEKAKSLEETTRQIIEAIKDHEKATATTSDERPSADDKAARRRAARQVFRLLTDSPDNFHVLLRGFGIEVTPAMQKTLQQNIAEASNSQADIWIQGAQQSEQTLALHQTIEQQSKDLERAKSDATLQKSLAFDMQRSKHEAETAATKEAHKVRVAENNVLRAKQEATKACEGVASLEEDVQSLKSENRVRENQLRDSREQASRHDAENQELRSRIDELEAAPDDLFDENQDLKDELGKQEIDLYGEIDRIQAASMNAAIENQKRLSDTESRLTESQTRLQTAETRPTISDSALDEAKAKPCIAESDLNKAKGSLTISRQETGKHEEDYRVYEKAISDQRTLLKAKTREIESLNQSAQQLTALLLERDGIIERQVEQASIFFQHLSVGAESGIMRSVAEKVLADSSLASSPVVQWKPWKILTSWSTGKALSTESDDHSLHAIALDVLAILGSKSSKVESLLSRLQALQDSIMASPSMVPSVALLLVGALTEAVGDVRLHLVHHVAMCQVAGLLVDDADAARPIEKAVETFDQRIMALLQAMISWDSNPADGFKLNGSISCGDVALVGFNRNPPGILVASLSNRELRWIDKAQTRNGCFEFELGPDTGSPMVLSIDSSERQLWTISHL
ncbi:hypothetical protein BKA59DRAFT_525917 [Fusarium tricinctum]|uniref:Uncharacterized protein n=1 Tax=Fusarium tricinctum TaxID=61284 RepID=A0A8K0S6J3_9HYPO|nr:hypothetical protein BKA59DRAFT_525917 [Fusarium tricinctum]